jgi:hypothetical protein
MQLSGLTGMPNDDTAVKWKIAGGCPNEYFISAIRRYPLMLRRIEDGKRTLIQHEAYRLRFSRL